MELIEFQNENIPKTFDESCFHQDKIVILKKIKILQNLLFFGYDGKKILINLLLNNIFKIKSRKLKTFIYDKNELSYKHSDYHIELDIQYIKSKDTDILLELIKEYSSTTSILNTSYKVIIIYNFDLLCKKIQYKLRTLVEKLTFTTRFILHCKQMSKVIKPILSRLLCIRVRCTSYSEIENFCKLISIKYNIKIQNVSKIIEQISELSIVSLSKLMTLLFIKYKSKTDKIRFQIKSENKYLELLKIIISEKSLEYKLNHSKELIIKLLENNYNEIDILKNILNIILLNKHLKHEDKYNILEKTLYYSTIINKNRTILILETYIVYLINFFNNNKMILKLE